MTETQAPESGPAEASDSLLQAHDLAKFFDVSPPWLNRVIQGERRAILKAVDGVSFEIPRGQTFSLEEPMAEFVVGRQDTCDLTVDSSYASRRHATIQAVRGKVFLKDHSTNGTYVRSETGDIAYVKREMVQLVGSDE